MKFEYRTLETSECSDLIQDLNSLGNERWELVTALASGTFLFKRTLLRKVGKQNGKEKEYNFDALYEKYPRKIGKSEGYKKLASMVDSENTFNSISNAIDNYRTYCRKNNTKLEYIKHFPTFLSSWQDWLNLVNDSGIKNDRPEYRPFVDNSPKEDEIVRDPKMIKNFIKDLTKL